MSYIVCDFTHGCEPLDGEYHFYEEARDECKRLSALCPDCKFGVEEVPDIEDLEREYD